jgi:hypothetical protein
MTKDNLVNQADRWFNRALISKFSDAYRMEVDTTDGSVIYQGVADLGSTTDEAVWRIKRITIAGAEITIDWADGDIERDNVWDDRAGLSYS